MARRSRQYNSSGSRSLDRIRHASITLLRGRYVSSRTWIQELNRTFDRLYELDANTTFSDALRAYADELDGTVQTTSPSSN